MSALTISAYTSDVSIAFIAKCLQQIRMAIIFIIETIDSPLLAMMRHKAPFPRLTALMETLFHGKICYAHNNYTPLFNMTFSGDDDGIAHLELHILTKVLFQSCANNM